MILVAQERAKLIYRAFAELTNGNNSLNRLTEVPQ